MGRSTAHAGQYVSWDQAVGSDFQFVSDIDNMEYGTTAPISDGPDGIYSTPQPGLTKEI